MYHDINIIPTTGINLIRNGREGKITHEVVHTHKHLLKTAIETVSQYGFLFRDWQKK